MTHKYLKWLAEDYRPIAGGALESNIVGLWFAKQTAKGAPVTFTTGTKRARWVGGDLQTNRSDGKEAWSDQSLFADEVDFVNTLIGNGAPVIQGQSSLVAYLCYLSCGQEVVTGGTNAVQTLTASATYATGGSFKLILTLLNGLTFTTAAIAWNATAVAIVAAIQAAMPGPWAVTGPTPSITATGGPISTTPVVLTFAGPLAAQPIPLFTVDATLLTGGTTPTVIPSSTTPGVPFQHVATPADTGGFYYGVAKSVGKSTVHRVQFNDCRTQSLRLEGSSASKVVKATPTFVSLDPGQIIAADPTKLDDGLKPLLYTEAVGAFNIDGTIYKGQSAFAVLLTWGLNEFYGDDVVPLDLINNTAMASIEGLTLLIDQNGLTRFNNQIYGTPTPATNAKPMKGIPLLGSYTATFTRTNPYTGLTSETMTITMPGVKWMPTLAIPANPAGGAVELSFTGEMRKVYSPSTGNLVAPFTITVQEPLDAAFSS